MENRGTINSPIHVSTVYHKRSISSLWIPRDIDEMKASKLIEALAIRKDFSSTWVGDVFSSLTGTQMTSQTVCFWQVH
jgi:hypothetical protein